MVVELTEEVWKVKKGKAPWCDAGSQMEHMYRRW